MSVYASNHSPAVLSSHSWRTVENSTPHLLPHLKADKPIKILDVGCGPGSITCSIASHVPSGTVIGIEPPSTSPNDSSPLTAARALATSQNLTNVTFQEGDIHALPFPDNTFDIVTAHQVLQHIRDPIQGFKEMHRVCKVGGIVADRESAALVWWPQTEGLRRWRELSTGIARSLGGNPEPGSRLHVWGMKAGFGRDSIQTTSSAWTFSTPQERQHWGGTMAKRVLPSEQWGKNCIEKGFSTEEELLSISQSWKEWVENEEGWLSVLNGEVVCLKV